MGKYKWDELGLKYPLEVIEPPTQDRVKNAKELLHVDDYNGYLKPPLTSVEKITIDSFLFFAIIRKCKMNELGAIMYSKILVFGHQNP